MSDLAVARPQGLAATGDLYVAFKVGDASYALPADSVLQMESFTSATVVPGTAPFVVGVMPIRGRVVPVLDLRVRFGMAAAPTTLDSRVIVTELRDRAVALLADSAREVLKLSAGDLKPPPALLEHGSQRFVKHIAHSGNRLLLVLDLAKVIGEESIDVG